MRTEWENLSLSRIFLVRCFQKGKYYNGPYRKSDSVFQIMNGLIQKKKTPLYVFIAEEIHVSFQKSNNADKPLVVINKLWRNDANSHRTCTERLIQEGDEFRFPIGQSDLKLSFMVQWIILTMMRRFYPEKKAATTKLSCCFRILTVNLSQQ